MGSGMISRLTICAFLGIRKTSKQSGTRTRRQSASGSDFLIDLGYQVFPQPGLAPGYRDSKFYNVRPRPDSYPFGRFAPYFERDCFRLATPAASSVPRITW